MRTRYVVLLASMCTAASSLAVAGRDPGWEFGGELLYQDSKDADFKSGSSIAFDSDVGVAFNAGYRFSDRLEVQFGLDWGKTDYKADIPSTLLPGVQVTLKGDMEAFTPYAGINFNFLESAITPYVSAGVGWSFVDTNIPNGPPSTSCWWDPWFGQVCGTWQDTRSVDSFMYYGGLGVRWDLSTGMSVRFGYEKRWLDVSSADGALDFDRIKLGISFTY